VAAAVLVDIRLLVVLVVNLRVAETLAVLQAQVAVAVAVAVAGTRVVAEPVVLVY
jgi:hypothetical protein